MFLNYRKNICSLASVFIDVQCKLSLCPFIHTEVIWVPVQGKKIIRVNHYSNQEGNGF